MNKFLSNARIMTLRRWINCLLILPIITSLAGCYDGIETEQGVTKETEALKIAVLDADENILLDQYDSISTVLPIAGIEVSEFDALIVSQTALESSESAEEIAQLTELFMTDKVLVILEDPTGNKLLRSPANDYRSTLRFTSSLPVLAKTFTSIDGKVLSGVILSPPEVSDTPPASNILKVLQQIEEVKREPKYNSLVNNSSMFSVAGSMCPYGQYLEIIEVDKHRYRSSESVDYWVIRLSQLVKDGDTTGSCDQSLYQLSNIRSIMQLNSSDGRIVDYAPTAGKGNQSADLYEDYSWVVGASNIDIVDKGNLPKTVEWLFNFPSSSNETNRHLSLTQPGLVVSAPTNQTIILNRSVQLGFEKDRWIVQNARREFVLDWQISIQPDDKR